MPTDLTNALTIALATFTALQAIALLVLVLRLLPGRKRPAPVAPCADSGAPATVTVLVATLNEAARIAPCLAGLERQGATLLETLIVDSNSTDGTRALVTAAAQRDPRIRLLTDDPLPPGWVGKVWALEHGLHAARGEWILGIDADTIPKPGMVAGLLHAVQQRQYDAASCGPRFVGQSRAERWLQPAMLMTLVYRCGAAGVAPPDPDRILANGQCFMARRSLLLAEGGYGVSRASFSDDVTLARHLAARGARVGFLDGSHIIDVRAYHTAGEMWREWGRSFDLKDGTSWLRRWYDAAFVWLTMALPVPILVALLLTLWLAPGAMVNGAFGQPQSSQPVGIFAQIAAVCITALLAVNALLLLIRVLLVYAVRGSYAERGWTFCMSWLADVPAAVRLTMSTARRPRTWRGRMYDPQQAKQTQHA